MRTDICQKLTFVMPTRIDSDARKRNLLYVTKRLSVLGCKIIILEADKFAHLNAEDINIQNVEYHFVEDANPCFFRTHYINILLRMSSTDVVAVWDADIVTSYEQIEEAYQYIANEDYILTYPYCGDYVLLNNIASANLVDTSNLNSLINSKPKALYARPFCGGAYFVNRERYLSLGGENEHFNGWGPEDVERQKRVEIMGFRYRWICNGKAYHLNHPRSKNSNFFSKRHKCKMENELVKVCSMDKEELTEYIKTW
ncbi:MAG: hypothetical protein J5525_10670 [Lachnospiraceae bacterium]|nr:hypothetical protein [Lachnospiraceae bacterium]